MFLRKNSSRFYLVFAKTITLLFACAVLFLQGCSGSGNNSGGTGGGDGGGTGGSNSGGITGDFNFPIVLEEDFNYPDQAGWPGWIVPTGGPGTATIVNQRGCLEGPLNTLVRMVLDDPENYQQVEGTYTAYPENIHNQGMGFYVPQNRHYLMADPANLGQGLVAYFEAGQFDELGFWTEINGVEMKRTATPLNTLLGETVTPEAGFPNNPSFHVRYRVEKSAPHQIRLRARMWRTENPEPSVWHLDYLLATGTGESYEVFDDFAGTVAFDLYNYGNPMGGSQRACFDDLVIRDLNPNPIAGIAAPTQVASSFGFAEGPVWVDEEGVLLFSDVSGDIIRRYNPSDGSVSVFRGDQAPNAFANGLARDIDGSFLICEQNLQRILDRDNIGNQTIIASEFDAGAGLQPFNSPNDVAVHSNGTIYFTDPTFGTLFNGALTQPLGEQGIYRVSPGGALSQITTATQPNGIALSPDESRLYVSDTVANLIRAFNVAADGSVTGEISGPGEVFPIAVNGGDGLAVDVAGNIYVARGSEGIDVFSRFGVLWGNIAVTEDARNVAFGDNDLKTLYITTGDLGTMTGSLYTVKVNLPGVNLPGGS